jgi:hypothetical protein
VRWGLDRLELQIEDVELLVETIILLAQEAGRKHLASPEEYSPERVSAFVASLLQSVR